MPRDLTYPEIRLVEQALEGGRTLTEVCQELGRNPGTLSAAFPRFLGESCMQVKRRGQLRRLVEGRERCRTRKELAAYVGVDQRTIRRMLRTPERFWPGEVSP